MRLRELHRWLTYEGASAGLGGTAFVVPYGIIFLALKVAAVVFTPYLLLRLYQCGRYGWMIAFGLLVGVPAIMALANGGPGVGAFVLSILPLFMFYLYTWVLRHCVGEWLEDLQWRRIDAASALD